jgi:peptide/nickel transport system permease protein
MDLAWFVLRRVALLAMVLVLVSLLTFVIVNVLPGDIANAILGDNGTPAQVAALRAHLGLDMPPVRRYFAWLGAMLTGDLGQSLQYGRPIAPILIGRLENSAILGGIAMLLATPLAIALGVLSAVKRGTLLDRFASAFALVSFALPEYVVGIVLILVFSIWWPVLPGSSLMDPSANPLLRPSALVLPVAVLVLGMLAYLSQVTRTTMIGVLARPFIRTAILKGLPMRVVILRHALPNVLPTTLVEVGMNLGYVLGGIVVVETLFSYAGVGQLIVGAIVYRDVPLLQVSVLVVAAAYCVGNLLADLGAAWFNPRLRGRA